MVHSLHIRAMAFAVAHAVKFTILRFQAVKKQFTAYGGTHTAFRTTCQTVSSMVHRRTFHGVPWRLMARPTGHPLQLV